MQRNTLSRTLVGIGAAATLLLPATGALADPGWGRPGGPKAYSSSRDDDDRKVRQDRRDDRRDRYDRREDRQERRDAYRYGYREGRRDDRREDREHRRDAYRHGYDAGRRDDHCDRRDGRRSNDTAEDIGLVIGGAVLGAIIANHR